MSTILSVEQLIRLLRISVCVQDPNAEVTQPEDIDMEEVDLGDEALTALDPEYLALSDEDMLLFLNLALSRNYPELPSLEYVDNESLFGLVLLSKKELYYSLATKEAPLYDLGADNNNYIKRSQRFDHYLKLIQQLDKEYNDWLDDGGSSENNTVRTYDVLLTDRFRSKKNFEKGTIPKVKVFIDEVTENSICISWSVRLSRFFSYQVFLSTEEDVIDLYDVKNPVKKSAKILCTLKNIHQTKCRIENLEPDTTYYIAVSAREMSTLTGHSQVIVKTKEIEPEEPQEGDDIEEVIVDGG